MTVYKKTYWQAPLQFNLRTCTGIYDPLPSNRWSTEVSVRYLAVLGQLTVPGTVDCSTGPSGSRQH